ncbi:MAG: hypothetical protein KJ737_22835 [Proteobacteria bacterium]|nr:hypothetical protein [Pseudomonadota bacterium]
MMSKKTLLTIVCIWFTASISFIACDKPDGEVPEEKRHPASRSYTQSLVDELVIMEAKSIYSPAPRENGPPPETCDYVRFLRFRLRNGSDVSSDADAALLMVPGNLGGANSLEYLARNLIYQAKVNHDLNLEVWAMDRRNNCLEDLTGLQAQEYHPDDYETGKNLFIDYYYHGLKIDGKTFDGFLTDKDTPYLSEFGLKMDTEDMYTIITTMMPDPELRRKKVFVGGHSLGGVHASMFSGWDFDGDPETLDDAGFRNLKGLFALDSTVSSTADIIDPIARLLPEYIYKLVENMTEVAYAGIANSLCCRI